MTLFKMNSLFSLENNIATTPHLSEALKGMNSRRPGEPGCTFPVANSSVNGEWLKGEFDLLLSQHGHDIPSKMLDTRIIGASVSVGSTFRTFPHPSLNGSLTEIDEENPEKTPQTSDEFPDS
jgi:hypothetical protein